MNKKIVLVRLKYDADRTIGRLFLFGDTKEVACFSTLELPWKNNTRNTSCIPKGSYQTKKLMHPRLGPTIHIIDVPNRDGILIHSGNFPSQTRGCVLVGDGLVDIDGDGLFDVRNSKAAMKALFDAASDEGTITIV